MEKDDRSIVRKICIDVAFNSEKMYKYYNPNLIRNQGLIKKGQNVYCDFPTSVTIYSSFGKQNTNKNFIR